MGNHAVGKNKTYFLIYLKLFSNGQFKILTDLRKCLGEWHILSTERYAYIRFNLSTMLNCSF